MKILVASDHYPPFIGGAQRQTWLLAHELKRRGHDVLVVTVWQVRLPATFDDAGVEVRRLKQLRTAAPLLRGPARRRHQPPFPDPVTVVALRRVLRRFRPDVVHAAGWFSASCAAALLGSDVPLIISARDYGFSCANTTLMREGQLCSGPRLKKCLNCAGQHYGRPRGWLAALGVLGSRPLLRRKATSVHSVSRYVDMVVRRDLIGERTLGRTQLTVIPSFRSEEEAAQTTETEVLRGLPNRPFILFVGALRRVKGIDELLIAYRQLDAPPPLVLVGTRELDTPDDVPTEVVVLADLPNWAVLMAWERSLFGVLPSRWPEPFGSVVHEAMSRGKAVIGTTPGGHADMIEDEVTGLLVPAGDAQALSRAMRRLVEDPDLRERLGAAARARAGDFTAATVIPRYERLYEDAVSMRRRHRSV